MLKLEIKLKRVYVATTMRVLVFDGIPDWSRKRKIRVYWEGSVRVGAGKNKATLNSS